MHSPFFMSTPYLYEMQVARIHWKNLPAHARVWVYQADRPLADDEAEAIQRAGERFVDGWSSHGQDMEAAFQVFHNRFLVVFADEEQAKASGCGIDRSVHFIQDVGQQLDIDFFDRMTLCYEEGESLRTISLTDIPDAIDEGRVDASTPFFDNLVQTKGELSEAWTKPMGEGWTSRYF